MECNVLCGGRCCVDFTLSHSGVVLGEMYRDAVARISACEDRPYDWEIVQVAEMVVRVDEDDETEPRYRCVNLSAAGLCSIYQQRPEMCRRYPTEGPCYLCGFQRLVSIERRLPANVAG